MRPATLRLARICGFRFDATRDAYVLRLVGGRFGPVLRTEPHDSLAQALQWQDQMEASGPEPSAEHASGERRRSRRFRRDDPRTPAPPQHTVQH